VDKGNTDSRNLLITLNVLKNQDPKWVSANHKRTDETDQHDGADGVGKKKRALNKHNAAQENPGKAVKQKHPMQLRKRALKDHEHATPQGEWNLPMV
jgi:hypothetical protein